MQKEAVKRIMSRNYNRKDGWKINKIQLPIMRQEKRRRETRDNITIDEPTILTNENFPCKKKMAKCKECQKQRTDNNNVNG